MEKRINELELLYMHQEKTLLELNEVVCRQELAIELLRQEINTMKEQSLLTPPSVAGDADQDKPPHY